MIGHARYYDSEKYHISYLRIPKTASTSIVKGMEMVEVEKPRYKRLITVIRNPYDRILSMYHECKRSNHRDTDTLSDWLDRVVKDGFYNNHANLQVAVFNQAIASGYKFWKIYDVQALELLEVDFRLKLPHENKTMYEDKFQYDEGEWIKAFAAFTRDFNFYVKMGSETYYYR